MSVSFESTSSEVSLARPALATTGLPSASFPSRIAPSDGELLALFKKQGDRAALERLTDRHAPMVWRVCRQMLRRPQDAEDAFQATFLLLVKNASSIGASDSAAGWLYCVAYRTSLRARKKLASRREEALALDPTAPSEEAFPDLASRQSVGVLAEELRNLPLRYQTPLVMRYLEGQSRRAIAEATDVTVATVQGRLARGKQLLRRRLVRRGVSLSAAMAALAAKPNTAEAAAPAHLVAQTTANGVAMATGGSLAASAAVVTLFQQGTRAMLLASMTKPLVATAVCGLAAVALLAGAEEPGAAGAAGAMTLSAEVSAEDSEAVFGEAALQFAVADSQKEGEPGASAPGVEATKQPAPKELLAQTFPDLVPRAAQTHSLAPTSAYQFAGPNAAANQRVLDALHRPLPKDNPLDRGEYELGGIIEAIGGELGIPTLINRNALDEIGLTPEEKVDFDPQGTTLAMTLKRALAPLELTVVVRDGALTATTEVDALAQLDLAVYPVGDLGEANRHLAATIKAMIAPDSWAERGGSDADIRLLPSGGVMLITQTQGVHEQIAALLDSLRRTGATERSATPPSNAKSLWQPPNDPSLFGDANSNPAAYAQAVYQRAVWAESTPSFDFTAPPQFANFRPGDLLQPPDGGRVGRYGPKNAQYGWSVKQLQQRLNEKLDPSPTLKIDGDYGPLTTNAVQRFQEQAGLKQTGFADTTTVSALGFVDPAKAAQQQVQSLLNGSWQAPPTTGWAPFPTPAASPDPFAPATPTPPARPNAPSAPQPPAVSITPAPPVAPEVNVSIDVSLEKIDVYFAKAQAEFDKIAALSRQAEALQQTSTDDDYPILALNSLKKLAETKLNKMTMSLSIAQDIMVAAIQQQAEASLAQAPDEPEKGAQKIRERFGEYSKRSREMKGRATGLLSEIGPRSLYSDQKTGYQRWNCHHTPTELNPHGWMTAAELGFGGTAPILLQGDARPRPHLRYDRRGKSSIVCFVEDEGFPGHGDRFNLQPGKPLVWKIRDRTVSMLWVPDPDSPKTERVLLLLRGFDASDAELPAATADEVRDAIRPDRRRAERELGDGGPEGSASNASLSPEDLKNLVDGLVKDPFGPKLARDDAEWFVLNVLMENKLFGGLAQQQEDPRAQLDAALRVIQERHPDQQERAERVLEQLREADAKEQQRRPRQTDPLRPPEPTATSSPGRLDYSDGKADGKKSLGGSGHLLRMELPEGAVGVKGVRIHGSRYGTPAAPNEDFEITLLSEDRSEILAVEHAPYGLFRRGEEKWTTVRFDNPLTDLPGVFWVTLNFNPGRTKGVYVSYDTSTGGERSMTGTSQQEPEAHKPVDFGGDWMVQAVLERP